MACLHPITIPNPRYKDKDPVWLNNYCAYELRYQYCIPEYKGKYRHYHADFWKGHIERDVFNWKPPDMYLKVPCGKCAECLKNLRRSWTIRLLYETRRFEHNTFITLTLNDKYLEEFINNPKRPLMLYIDRLRKHLGYRPRYFFVPELGNEEKYTGRLHYHGIIFDTPSDKLPYSTQKGKWKYGVAFTGYCNDKTCRYVVKYMFKDYGLQGFKPFTLCSNGIGKSYLDKPGLQEWHVNNFDFRDCISFEGQLYPLPVYYRNCLYDDEIKRVRMFNRIAGYELPFEKELFGSKYTNPLLYQSMLDERYKLTLAQGLSVPLKPRIDLLAGLRTLSKNDSFNAFALDAYLTGGKYLCENLKLF